MAKDDGRIPFVSDIVEGTVEVVEETVREVADTILPDTDKDAKDDD